MRGTQRRQTTPWSTLRAHVCRHIFIHMYILYIPHLCIRACVHARATHAYMYSYTCTFVHVHACIYVSRSRAIPSTIDTCMHTRVRTRMCVYMHVCLHVPRMYTCILIHVHIYTHITFVYMYVYIHI